MGNNPFFGRSMIGVDAAGNLFLSRYVLLVMGSLARRGRMAHQDGYWMGLTGNDPGSIRRLGALRLSLIGGLLVLLIAAARCDDAKPQCCGGA